MMREGRAKAGKNGGMGIGEAGCFGVEKMLGRLEKTVRDLQNGDLVTKLEDIYHLRNEVRSCSSCSECIGRDVMERLLGVEYEKLEDGLVAKFAALLESVVTKFGVAEVEVDDRMIAFLERAVKLPECQRDVLVLAGALRERARVLPILLATEWKYQEKNVAVAFLCLWQKVLVDRVDDEVVKMVLRVCWELASATADDDVLRSCLDLLLCIVKCQFGMIPWLLENCQGFGGFLARVFREKAPEIEAVYVLQIVGYVYGRSFQIPDFDSTILLEALEAGNERLFVYGCFAITNFVLSTQDTDRCMTVLHRMMQLLQTDIQYQLLLEVSSAMLNLLDHTNLDPLPSLFDNGLMQSLARILDVCDGYQPKLIDQFFRVMMKICTAGATHGWHDKFCEGFVSFVPMQTISDLEQKYDSQSLKAFASEIRLFCVK